MAVDEQASKRRRRALGRAFGAFCFVAVPPHLYMALVVVVENWPTERKPIEIVMAMYLFGYIVYGVPARLFGSYLRKQFGLAFTGSVAVGISSLFWVALGLLAAVAQFEKSRKRIPSQREPEDGD